MFDQLSDRLQGVLSGVRSRGKLSDDDGQQGPLREVRLALLEADVNFKVVKDFTDALKVRLAGRRTSPTRSIPARRSSRPSTTSSPR